LKKNEILNGFTIFVALACLLTITLNMINGRFLLGDFMVYYTAAGNLISGKPVYLATFYGECGYYKYSPATLFFFFPYLFFNFKTAAIIHFGILGIACWYVFVILRRFMREYFLVTNLRHEVWVLGISFACILIHFTRELYLGNINIILLLLCCLAMLNFLRSKDIQGGLLFGIVVLAKPYLLVLLLPLLLRKKWRALTWTGIAIAGGLILPFIFPGPQKSMSLYGDWIQTILNHNDGYAGMTSLDYLFRHYFPAWPAWGILVIFLFGSAMTAVFILSNLFGEQKEGSTKDMADMNFVFEWFLLIALLPNLIPTDWVLLLFTAPIITFMMFYVSSRKQYWWIPVMVVLLFFYGANSDDLLGRELSHAILESGIIGLSNFILVIAALLMFMDYRKRIIR
jgi:hypothetical protein